MRHETIYSRRHWKPSEIKIIMTKPVNQKGQESLNNYIDQHYLLVIYTVMGTIVGNEVSSVEEEEKVTFSFTFLPVWSFTFVHNEKALQ